jgi:hypothetical protein
MQAFVGKFRSVLASGQIPCAIAAFNDVDADDQSVSGILRLQTGNYGN